MSRLLRLVAVPVLAGVVALGAAPAAHAAPAPPAGAAAAPAVAAVGAASATTTAAPRSKTARGKQVSTLTVAQARLTAGTARAEHAPLRAGLPNPDAAQPSVPLAPVQVAPVTPAPGRTAAPDTAAGGTSITGLDQAGSGGYGPSDVSAAAGSTDVLETVNEAFAVYSKSGTKQYSTTLQNWFGCGSSCPSVFDPHVVFETFGNRYLMVADDGKNWRLSVARQTSGTGNWCNYTFNAQTASGQFADYPEIGADARYIYLTMVEFSNNSFVSNKIIAIPRSTAESCGTVTYQYWQGIHDPGTSQMAFHIAPATAYGSASSSGWMADAYPGGGSHITVHYIDGSNVLHSKQLSTPSYSVPLAARQPGGSYLDTGEPGFTNVVAIGGEIYLATTSGYDWGNGNKNSVVLWLQVHASASSTTVDKRGSFGYAGLWYFYPSSAGAPAAGQYQAFNYALSGASRYVSAAVSEVDYTGAIKSNFYSVYGSAAYTGVTRSGCSSSPCYRWGDYSSMYVDPTNSATVWTTEAYAKTNSNWGTRMTQVHLS